MLEKKMQTTFANHIQQGLKDLKFELKAIRRIEGNFGVHVGNGAIEQ